MNEEFPYSQVFLEAILDQIPNLVFMKDKKLAFVYVNQSVATFFGTTKEAILGKADKDFIHDKDQLDHFANADRQVLLTQKPLRISEEFLSDGKGRRLRLATTKVPYLVPPDNVYVLGVATDITDIPGGHEADSLRLAIISDITHVIRTPIANAVMCLSQMARSVGEMRDAGYSRLLLSDIQMIRAALLALDNSSRNFAKIAQGLYSRGSVSQPEAILFQQLLIEQINEIRQIVPTALIHINVDRNVSGFRVPLDPIDQGLVKTAIYNIIYNAIKFSKTDSPIHVTLLRQETGIRFEVKDAGTGIHEADLPRVFEPGFTKRAGGLRAGTGMGLTIAKEVFERLGWSISIASKQSVGTTVTVEIPKS